MFNRSLKLRWIIFQSKTKLCTLLPCVTLRQGGIPQSYRGVPMQPPMGFDANPFLRRPGFTPNSYAGAMRRNFLISPSFSCFTCVVQWRNKTCGCLPAKYMEGAPLTGPPPNTFAEGGPWRPGPPLTTGAAGAYFTPVVCCIVPQSRKSLQAQFLSWKEPFPVQNLCFREHRFPFTMAQGYLHWCMSAESVPAHCEIRTAASQEIWCCYARSFSHTTAQQLYLLLCVA